MKDHMKICFITLMLAAIPVVGLGADKTGVDAVKLMDQGKTEEALGIFRNLAAKGDDKAMVQLGIYYYQGTGVSQDYTAAMEWWLQAFSNQNADAFVNLGVMHRDGLGVPKNKKIAYCVFLATHMSGLGSQSTQLRSNNCLRRILEELSKDDIKDCLSNYTLGYITAYLEEKGKMNGIPEKYKPSQKNPALRDLDWWLDGELDAIYGPPSEEEKRARQERDRQLMMEFEALQHTLVFQIRFSKDAADHYRSYDVITDEGMESGPIPEKKLQVQDQYHIYEDDALIYENQHRYITVEHDQNDTLVFRIDHPVKPSPCDWSKWQKPVYALQNGMDKFALIYGGEAKSKTTDLPTDIPELRFKVIKK